MKIIASIKKEENVRFVSHLDVQRMLQRTVRRADIPIAFSQGFNPHPLISFATALATGQTGECEWVEFRLEKDMSKEEFTRRMNDNFPTGFGITGAFIAREGLPAIANLMVWSEYCVKTYDAIDKQMLEKTIADMLSGEIIVKKRKKQGGRKLVDAKVDIREMVYEFYVVRCDTETQLYIKGRQDASGGLNAELLVHALDERLGSEHDWHIHRRHIELSEK